jgi:hypothetical protein
MAGLVRFGPLAAQDRAIALGKASLLGNAGALVRRARRFHLLAPYAEAARGRLVHALSLPRDRVGRMPPSTGRWLQGARWTHPCPIIPLPPSPRVCRARGPSRFWTLPAPCMISRGR